MKLVGPGQRYCGYWIFGILATWILDIWESWELFFEFALMMKILFFFKKEIFILKQKFSIKNLVFRSKLLDIWIFSWIFGFFWNWILDICSPTPITVWDPATYGCSLQLFTVTVFQGSYRYFWGKLSKNRPFL